MCFLFFFFEFLCIFVFFFSLLLLRFILFFPSLMLFSSSFTLPGQPRIYKIFWTRLLECIYIYVCICSFYAISFKSKSEFGLHNLHQYRANRCIAAMPNIPFNFRCRVKIYIFFVHIELFDFNSFTFWKYNEEVEFWTFSFIFLSILSFRFKDGIQCDLCIKVVSIVFHIYWSINFKVTNKWDKQQTKNTKHRLIFFDWMRCDGANFDSR